MDCRLIQIDAVSPCHLDCGFPDDNGVKPEYTASFLHDGVQEVVTNCVHLESYQCHAEDSFAVNGNLIAIPDAYRSKVGSFVCQQRDLTCKVQWPPSEKSIHVASLESNGNLGTTAVVTKKIETLSTPSQNYGNGDNAVLVIGLATAAVVLIILGIIVIAVVLIKKRKATTGYNSSMPQKKMEEGPNEEVKTSDSKKIPIDGYTNKNSGAQTQQLCPALQNLLMGPPFNEKFRGRDQRRSVSDSSTESNDSQKQLLPNSKGRP